jgi:hypothetical protein
VVWFTECGHTLYGTVHGRDIAKELNDVDGLSSVWRWLLGWGLLGGCSLLLAIAAPASAQPSDFALGVANRTPASATALTLHIVYRDPANPQGKPSPIRHLAINLPAGTLIHVGSVAGCTASDEAIMAMGPGACPPASRVGSGTLTAITGFGPPIDPFLTDVSIFNTGQGWLEIVQDHQTHATLAADRIKANGSTLTGNPPSTPGGPPDGESAVRTIDFTFPASSGYVTTPPSCPSSEVWMSTAAFTFADGSIQHVQSAAPCSAQQAASLAACSHVIAGTRHSDRLNGTPVSDRIQGRGGRDRINGRGGGDCLAGSRGRDRIRGGRGDDRIRAGAGADRIRSGPGNDVVRVRRGGRDRVNCGPGHDTVFASRIDRAKHCEVVKPARPRSAGTVDPAFALTGPSDPLRGRIMGAQSG